ncbi:MAG: ABC transporter ATP-binding protein [Armatimonadetes bacterium]|jgi:ABC-2 type transport system ATP-binding protein|nr:ABC transporter ATP-binding protein [Armatimonadota bacterium]
MIEIREARKQYGDQVAVQTLNLQVNDGEIFGFIGPNGAGKTTTIKMTVGMLRPDAGSIRVNGIDVWQEPLLAKQCIGYVPDNPDVYEKLTGLQFIRFVADAYRVPLALRRQRTEELSAAFAMQDALGDLIESYSHGMRQKIVLIAALVHAPRVWMLDEPLVGLDPKASLVLKTMMREHANQGNTVFFSTHILEVAERLCDRVGIIHRGQLVACGSLDQLRTERSETLESIFMEVTEQ